MVQQFIVILVLVFSAQSTALVQSFIVQLTALPTDNYNVKYLCILIIHIIVLLSRFNVR